MNTLVRGNGCSLARRLVGRASCPTLPGQDAYQKKIISLGIGKASGTLLHQWTETSRSMGNVINDAMQVSPVTTRNMPCGTWRSQRNRENGKGGLFAVDLSRRSMHV